MKPMTRSRVAAKGHAWASTASTAIRRAWAAAPVTGCPSGATSAAPPNNRSSGVMNREDDRAGARLRRVIALHDEEHRREFLLRSGEQRAEEEQCERWRRACVTAHDSHPKSRPLAMRQRQLAAAPLSDLAADRDAVRLTIQAQDGEHDHLLQLSEHG